jgi:hypothetical protein
MPLYGDILLAKFFDLKNSINRQINGDLEVRFWNQFFGVISPSDIFKNILENY